MNMGDDLYFVIDTNLYAGNFERPMCAFVTGQVGECGVGEKEAEIFEEEVEDEEFRAAVEDLIGAEPDDHGCHRPAKIYPTPGWFNNGNGGHYREDDPDAEEKALRERDEEVKRYAENTIRRCYADKDYGNKEADRHLKENLGQPLTRYPAFQSVAICLTEIPEPEMLDFLKKRARRFAAEHKSYDGKPSPIEIEGFRLIRVHQVEEVIE